MAKKGLFQKSAVYTFVIVALMSIVGIYRNSRKNTTEKKDVIKEGDITIVSGSTMGTYYDVRYLDNRNLKPAIDSVLKQFNLTFSTYIPESEISRFNKSKDTFAITNDFKKVYNKGSKITKLTSGAFDPAIAPLVNLWGFGPNKRNGVPSQAEIDSILQFSGSSAISLQGNKLIKAHSSAQLDFSAIAKGRGVDVVASYLQSLNITNYKVEIGGELVCSGDKNGDPWIIGIESPRAQTLGGSIQLLIRLDNKGMATSGNYRNFFEEDGKIYAHTLSPKEGKPVKNSLLSTTVIATDCMTADALATGFMVMGVEKAKKLAEEMNEIEAYFIYADGDEIKIASTTGFKEIVVER